LGPYNSGVNVSTNNMWTKSCQCQIKVKAKDDPDGNPNTDDGQESDWSDPLSVIMPKSKPYINTLFLNFLQNHPRMFPLLRQALGL